MKKYILAAVVSSLAFGWGCEKDEDFLNREPSDELSYDQVWEDEGLVLAVLADFYGRYPDYQMIERWWDFTNFNEAFASNFGDYHRHKNQNYSYFFPGMGDPETTYWDYGLIRELNLFITEGESRDELDETLKSRFLAEARFIRAGVYFEHAKRVGGVPLILEPMEYDFSGDPTYLQHPRAKEHELYDFIISEMEAIKSLLPDDPNTKSRATKAAALAMECRAALYAGSIARYGATTPQVSLPGDEVGIPVEMAEGYYETALRAAEEITGYSLYMKNPDDLESNFANLFLDKNGNPEVIFVEDYKLQSGKVHGFTISNQPLSLSEEAEGGRLNPSLNLVQSFELLDNSFAPMATHNASGDYIYYENPEDIFAGRDARLGGTVIYPGASFKGEEVDIWAGYMLEDGGVISAAAPGNRATLPGKDQEEQVVGFDGPIDGYEWTAQTGFYVRKYLDPASGAGSIGTQSAVWWIRYRYAEVLLNAAEAAFELNQLDKAAMYLNQVRKRAGFTVDLAPSEITFDRIVHARRVELAFEDHRLWDMKRWRLAHKVWNGTNHALTNEPGKAEELNTRPFGLWPYRFYAPGNPDNGKWVFREIVPREVTNPDRFRLGNYYSFISDEIRTNNPKIVRNPNH